MPGMDGVETTVRIREWERESKQVKPVPIIALTANVVVGMNNIFLEAGMNDFVSKPINTNQLNRVLKKWLPPEKITLKAGELAKKPTALDDPLLQELSGIEGLDVSAGLMHVGYSRQGYYLALRQFSESCDSYLEDLNDAMKAEAWEDYCVKAHAIKGVFAVFGTEQLSQWAARLEKITREHKFGGQALNTEFSPETCRKETPLFCDALREFNALLRKTSLFSPDEKAGDGEKTKGDIQFLWEQIKQLKEACKRCSTEEAEKIVARFGEYKWDKETEERLDKIRRLTSSYDYNAILDEIEFYR